MSSRELDRIFQTVSSAHREGPGCRQSGDEIGGGTSSVLQDLRNL